VSRYAYRQDVLAALLVHGVIPTDHTPPEVARDFVRDLYKYELRQLRDRYVKKEFAKTEYSTRVIELRDKYPVLALVARQWVT
jgi:hypothetical protein